MITRNSVLFILCFVQTLGFSLRTEAQTQSLFDKLEQEEALEITIEADFNQLINQRNTNDYLKGNIICEKASGEIIEHEIKIRPRGKFRRRICDFPPLKLKFPKSELEKAGLKDFNDFKLVTHCLDDKFDSKENVLKEILSYKIYNELTDYSLKTQLVKVTYIDKTGNFPKVKRYGFLIEDIEELASRMEGEECDCLNANPTLVSTKDENLMAMYQYMIGNSDWSTPLLRNVKLVQSFNGPIVPVAYDFDFAGIVNAPYAIPNPDYNLVSVKQRVFLGWEVGDTILLENIALFMDRKDAIYKVVENYKELSKPLRQEMIEYLDTFYDGLSQLMIPGTTDLYAKLKGNNSAPGSNGNGSLMYQGVDNSRGRK